jgi:hypothetical protein
LHAFRTFKQRLSSLRQQTSTLCTPLCGGFFSSGFKVFNGDHKTPARAAKRTVEMAPVESGLIRFDPRQHHGGATRAGGRFVCCDGHVLNRCLNSRRASAGTMTAQLCDDTRAAPKLDIASVDRLPGQSDRLFIRRAFETVRLHEMSIQPDAVNPVLDHLRCRPPRSFCFCMFHCSWMRVCVVPDSEGTYLSCEKAAEVSGTRRCRNNSLLSAIAPIAVPSPNRSLRHW